MESSESKNKAISDSEKESADELEAKAWTSSFDLRQLADRQAKVAEMQAALASGELGDHDFYAEDSTDLLSLALDEFEAAERAKLTAADSEVPRANAQLVESRERAQMALQNFFASRGDYLQPPQKLVVTVEDVRNFISKRNERALNTAPIHRSDDLIAAPAAWNLKADPSATAIPSPSSTGKKAPETIAFQTEVHRLMDQCWNEREPGSNPTKTYLQQQVVEKLRRSPVKPKRSKDPSFALVKSCSTAWVKPSVIPPHVPPAQSNAGRHPWKGEK